MLHELQLRHRASPRWQASAGHAYRGRAPAGPSRSAPALREVAHCRPRPCSNRWHDASPALGHATRTRHAHPTARAAELGAALITVPLWSKILARRARGLPWNVTPCAVITLGWPIGRYGPTTRRPVAELFSLDRFGN